jgi:gamma-glutamyltranspeptidase / glutathione hydrolase
VADKPPGKQAVARGFGGAVVSDTVESTQAGLEVLRRGGTAADAAVAVAAVLGVTDPYVAGVGGGGFFVFYDARTRRVSTIDGRETTPAAGDERMFLDANGVPLAFPTAVTSGLGVGVPGNLATWQRALDKWGRFSLGDNLRPAIRVADQGFVVDATFREQTRQNEARFRQFSSTTETFLPNGALPVVGSKLRNPDLADTYREIARHGIRTLYGGSIGRDLVAAQRNLPLAPDATLVPIAGRMTLDDLRRYRAIDRDPTHVRYHDLDVFGMGPPSSGGITVGEALNILERFDMSTSDRVQALHRYLEASRLAFADRGRFIGDSDFVNVPQRQLLSNRFAAQRACLIDPTKALTSPVAPGDPNGSPSCSQSTSDATAGNEGAHTNHFTVSDRWGNAVAYTNTIEQLGGSGIVVPGRGFLLNNELTDFNFAPTQGTAPDPNLPAAGKRPRSSMSPTIVLRDGRPFLTVGSPGGATIITTVLQILVNRLDFGMSLPDAIAAPRASQRNAATTQAEPAFLALPTTSGLQALGHAFAIRDTSPLDPTIKISPDIGVASGLEFLRNGEVIAAGEPTRRGGSSAGVVFPRR